jgi:DNA-binding NarL/FixJ family response regulator
MKDIPHILIVEDEPLIAEDIADICQLNGYEVCGIAYRATQAIRMIEAHRPNFILLDIHLNDDLDGIELAQYLRKNHSLIPFLFLTSYSDQQTLAKARATSPLGYIVKPFSKEQLYTSIEIAWAQYQHGKAVEFNGEQLNARLSVPLSPREMDVLACVYKGISNKGIGDQLFISVNTVKYHLKKLYDKFDVHNRGELVYRVKETLREG